MVYCPGVLISTHPVRVLIIWRKPVNSSRAADFFTHRRAQEPPGPVCRAREAAGLAGTASAEGAPQFLPLIQGLSYKRGRSCRLCSAMIRTIFRHIAAAALLLASAARLAQSPPSAAPQGGIGAILDKAKKGDDFLPPDQAFRFAALAEDSDRVSVTWQIADGYYLYRARVKVATTSKQAQLGATQFPPGQVKNDEYFGRQEVSHHELTATVPVARAAAGALEL